MSKPKPVMSEEPFSLLPPYDRYASYRIEWNDKSKQQRVGLSTGTTDIDAAKAIFQKHVLNNSSKRLKDEPLLNSCNRYFFKYAHALPSVKTFKRALASTIKVLANPDEGNFGPLVSEMGLKNQNKLIDTWRANGVADWTILRWMGCLWAAMKYAAENEHLNATVIPKRISNKRWKPDLPNRTRVLSVEEMATLLDAACLIPSHVTPRFSLHPPRRRYTSYQVWYTEPETSKTIRLSLDTTDVDVAAQRLKVFERQYLADHPVTYTEQYDGLAFRSLLSLIATGSRQQALVDLLMPTQIKFEYGVMDLNPVGRKQTIKFRPIIPMAQTYAQWLAVWQPLTADGHLLGTAGVPIVSMRPLFKTLSKRTGIRCSAHIFRHTLSSWLSARVKAPWERDQFMGWQRSEGSAMGSIYSHYDPKYLRECSDAVQQLLEAIAERMVGDLLRRGRVDQPAPPSDAQLAWMSQGLSQGFGRWVNGTALTPPDERIVVPPSGLPADPNPAGGASEEARPWYVRGTEGSIPTSAFPECDENPYKSSLIEVGRLGLEPRTNTLKGSEPGDKTSDNQ